jgi:hypothetical protein
MRKRDFNRFVAKNGFECFDHNTYVKRTHSEGICDIYITWVKGKVYINSRYCNTIEEVYDECIKSTKEDITNFNDLISRRTEQVLMLENVLIDFNVMKVRSSRSAPSARLTATP